jgi:glycosyltransferase involved in cell wall biosynthesis
MRVLLAWGGPLTVRDRATYRRRHVAFLRQLAADGVHAVVVLLGDGGGSREDLAETGIAVEVVPIRSARAAGFATLPYAVATLRSAIARHRPDVVDASDPLPGIAAGLAARGLRRSRRPVVMYRRHFYAARPVPALASRIAARLADRMVASCESMRHYVAGVEGKPLRLVDVATSGIADPPPIGPVDIASARRSLGILDEAFVIGAVANLHWRKGIDVLIRALERLPPARDVHLVIVGTGPEEGNLRRLAARAPVPVHFLGHRDDVQRWMAASDVMAMPSRSESFGRVTLEAMSVGRPLVASRVGGLPDAVVDGETGVLVPVDDADALGAALGALVIDRACAQLMGAAARARFEAHYTIAHMAASWRRAWERAVAASRNGAVRP